MWVAKKALPPLVAARLPVARRETSGRIGDKSFVMVDPGRCVVAKELFWGDGRLPRSQDDFALHLFVELARDADLFFDIGSYTGVFTVAATTMNPSIRGYAFELVPETFGLLVANCARNDVLWRVDCRHAAVGDPQAVARVPATPGRASLPMSFSVGLFKEGARVRIDSLDDYIPPEGTRVVLKIDVEGSEEDVFRHGQHLIRGFRPDIVCEFLPGVDVSWADAFLREYGYMYWRISGDGLIRSENLNPDPELRDWLLTTRSPDQVERLNALLREVAAR